MSPDRAEWAFPNRATPLGSPAYYAVRFSPETQRERNALLLGWQSLIDDIAADPHDPGVARIKLDWWRSEVESLDNGRPRHPLLGALVDAGANAALLPPMHRLIDAAEAAIRTPQPHDDDAFVDACRASNGAFFALLAAATRDAAYDAAACDEAGGYCAAVARVQRLAEAPRRVPPDAQPAALQGLDAAQRRARLDGLLSRFVLPQRPDNALPDLAHRLTALATAIHRKMQRKGYPVLDSLVDRAPIAHLWTAWRCR